MPTLMLTAQGPRYALALALLLGALDGWFRLRLARTARSLAAEADALVISSGLGSVRVPWSDVLAVEVWHRMNRVDHAAVHYRTRAGNAVASCWEQDGREELLLFVPRCAELAQAARPRQTIVRVHLGDKAAYLALLRRLSFDVAIALFVGTAGGITTQAVWLGAAAGLISAIIATTPYLHHPEIVHRDGAWWQRRKNGELARLRVLPQSLRLWASYLNASEPIALVSQSRAAG